MEVPHHMHQHKSAKSWKSYFGEFLMLFIADLQKDALQLQQVADSNRDVIKGIDSYPFIANIWLFKSRTL